MSGVQPFGQVHAVPAGEAQVEQRQLGGVLRGELQSLGRVTGLKDCVALALQHAPQHLANRGIIIHYQNSGRFSERIFHESGTSGEDETVERNLAEQHLS